jgi:hypothetical protein
VSVDLILIIVALILAIVSLVDQRYPWLSAAVICLAVSLLV